MPPRQNNRGKNPGVKRDTKIGGKNGKKEGASGSSFFTWFMVIALLGVWTSVAVVWFDLVDYEEVLGKLGVYDADGDGDFDVDDAKILLGLKEGPEVVQATSTEEEPEDPVHPDVTDDGDDVEELIHATRLHEAHHSPPDDETEEDVVDEQAPLEEEKPDAEHLYEDLYDDGKEELPSEGQLEEEEEYIEDGDIQVEPLAAQDLHGEPEQEEPEGVEDHVEEATNDETEDDDNVHSNAEVFEEDEPAPPEVHDSDDIQEETDETGDAEGEGEFDRIEDEEPEQESFLEAEPELESEEERGSEPETEQELDPEPTPETEPEAELDLESESEVEPPSEPEPQPESEPAPEREYDFEDEPEPEVETESTQEPEQEQEPEPEPEHPTEEQRDHSQPDAEGNTEQENAHISDKHPDDREENALPVETQKEQPSDI